MVAVVKIKVIYSGLMKSETYARNGNVVWIHNDIDNAFYETLKLSHQTVFVEHSTAYCELKPHEHALFKDATGSDWVWFTRTLKKKQVTCIDTRLENGFLSAYEERAMRDMPVKDLMEAVARVMRAASAIKENYAHIHDVYEDIISTMKRQFLILALLSSNTDTTVKVHDKTIKKDIVYNATKNFLISNAVKLAALSVDMNIIAALASHKDGSPVSIFVGINHALRVSDLLNLRIVTDDELLEPFWEGAAMYSDGDKDSEMSIIAHLKGKK
jgi:hypothetical protein